MCNCSSSISNCDCNDCSFITIPSSVGPQGPPGNNGTNGSNGTNGLNAGNVIDTEIVFVAGPAEGAVRRYTPEILITPSTELTKTDDRLKIRAVFALTSEAAPASGVLGVYINSTASMVGATALAEFSGTIPNSKYFYIEFYFDRYTTQRFNVTGTAKFSNIVSEIGQGLFLVPAESSYVIRRINQLVTAPTVLNSPFYIFLGSQNLGYILPTFFTVEYILRK
jgi:hypothetical protein